MGKTDMNQHEEPLHPNSPSRLSAATVGRLALAPQGVLVKQVLRHLVVLSIHAGEVGDVVTQLLDGFHLLVQVVGLQEVAQLQAEPQNRC